MHLSVTEIVHDLVRPHVRPGDTALDGTAGNGHDSLFLARCVGPTGRVIAWDIQPLAIDRTTALLAKHGVTWVELILGDHADLDRTPGSPLSAALFNLGYLPASDRSIVTTTASSVRAIHAAVGFLRPGGILTVLAYTGHCGGAEEAEAIRVLLASQSPVEYKFREVTIPAGRTAPPKLFALKRRPQTLRGKKRDPLVGEGTDAC